MLIQGNDPYCEPSFSLGHRSRRAIWNIVQSTLFAWSPRPFFAWRRFLLQLFGARVGKGCHVYPRVQIWAPWQIELGKFVGVADGVRLYSMAPIRIGDYAVVSQGAYLCCGTHDYNSFNFQLVAQPIQIGERAWICAEAFIHPGVSVAEGVVIGARAVLTGDIAQPWTIYAGNPARPVGRRAVSTTKKVC